MDPIFLGQHLLSLISQLNLFLLKLDLLLLQFIELCIEIAGLAIRRSVYLGLSIEYLDLIYLGMQPVRLIHLQHGRDGLLPLLRYR